MVSILDTQSSCWFTSPCKRYRSTRSPFWFHGLDQSSHDTCPPPSWYVVCILNYCLYYTYIGRLLRASSLPKEVRSCLWAFQKSVIREFVHIFCLEERNICVFWKYSKVWISSYFTPLLRATYPSNLYLKIYLNLKFEQVTILDRSGDL